MRLVTNPGCSNRPVVVFIQVVASIIAIFAFFTGIVSLPQLIKPFINNLFEIIDNPEAARNGILWKATFFGNEELSPPITLEGRIRGLSNGLEVDWRKTSPGGKTPEDHFSVSFYTTAYFLTGYYCFVITNLDDGRRLYVDGEEILSAWWGYTPDATNNPPHKLIGGEHQLQFNYKDFDGNASFKLFWYDNAGPECVKVGHPGVK